MSLGTDFTSGVVRNWQPTCISLGMHANHAPRTAVSQYPKNPLQCCSNTQTHTEHIHAPTSSSHAAPQHPTWTLVQQVWNRPAAFTWNQLIRQTLGCVYKPPARCSDHKSVLCGKFITNPLLKTMWDTPTSLCICVYDNRHLKRCTFSPKALLSAAAAVPASPPMRCNA